MTMGEELKQVADGLAENLIILQKVATNLTAQADKERDKIYAVWGYERCKECNGSGVVERLDSRYALEFDIATWEGCRKCGGSIDSRGRGCIAKG